MTALPTPRLEQTAVASDCGGYRYFLTRRGGCSWY